MSGRLEIPSELASLPADQVLGAVGLVAQGRVAKSAGVYVDQVGCRLAEELTGVVDRLVWAGWVCVSAGDPIWDRRVLDLTEVGRGWYAHVRQVTQAGGSPGSSR